MSHRAALGGLSGQVPGELESRLSSIKRILDIMDAAVAKRVGLSPEAYKKLIYDELWLDGQSAVKTGHADRIAKIKCSDKIIAATRSEVVRTFFGPVQVTFSKCPLISGILDLKLAKESKFRSEAEAMALVKKTKRSVVFNF